MEPKDIKMCLEEFFTALADDELGCHSSDSVLAGIHIEKQPTFNMQKIETYTKDGKKKINPKALARYRQWFGTKRHKQPKPSKPSAGKSVGGFSRIENNQIFVTIRRVYVGLPPEWRNLLREHVSHGASYDKLAVVYKEYRLTPHQIRAIFRRKIYPKFEEILTDLAS